MSNIPFIVISLIIIAYILISIRKEKLSVAASFMWVLFCFIMLFLSIFPNTIIWLSNIFGVAYPPSLLFIICTIILFLINFNDNKRIDELETKINDLAEELNILRSKNGKK
jgi:hypothetical protein